MRINNFFVLPSDNSCDNSYLKPNVNWRMMLDKMINDWNPQMMSNKNSIVQKQEQQPQQPSHNRLPPPPPESMSTTTTWITTATS